MDPKTSLEVKVLEVLKYPKLYPKTLSKKVRGSMQGGRPHILNEFFVYGQNSIDISPFSDYKLVYNLYIDFYYLLL